MILQTSKLIDDLTLIAQGDVCLVEKAIVDCAGSTNSTDLLDVIRYIVKKQHPAAPDTPPEPG